MGSKLTEAETIINNDIQEFKDKAKAEAEKKMAERQQLFAQNGYTVVAGNYVSGVIILTPEQIAEFTEEDVEVYINLGKKELKRQEEEKARKIQEKKEFEKRLADLEAREKRLAEREKAVQIDKEIVNEEIKKIEPAQQKIEVAEEKINAKFPPNVVPRNEGVQVTKKTPYEAGFDNLRTQLIEFIQDKSNKLNRPIIIEWAKNAKLKTKK